jgi:hypothetical protein
MEIIINTIIRIKGIKPNNGLFIDSITNQLEFKYDSSHITLDASNIHIMNLG